MQPTIILSEASIQQIVLHHVGNKSQEEGIRIAKRALPLQEEMHEVLTDYFLNNFKLEELYQFQHETDLDMNEVYTYCKYIFDDPAQFYDQSVNILRHLYEQSNHVRVKSGELYVVHFENCVIDDELVNAIGIFKSETKDTFLKLVQDEEGEWVLSPEEGFNITQLDKGCMVFNTETENGYRVISVDLKSSEAKYWCQDFLNLHQIQDDQFYTQAYMNMCRQFSKDSFKEEDKNERAAFINKSLEYFEANDEFDTESFKEMVFDEAPQQALKFDDYKESFKTKKGWDLEETNESFFIEPTAVKKMKKGFRNVIKLDTDVELKFQSSQAQTEGLLERGFDEEKGMHFYKIYFNTEK